MKFGVSVTFAVALGAPLVEQGAYVERLARVIEDSGLDSIWFADCTVYPSDLVARYSRVPGSGVTRGGGLEKERPPRHP